MHTEKMYYSDAYINNFSAKVLSCKAQKDGFIVILDRTAFFPEGGGQKPDTGYIGNSYVSDVQEKDGIVVHSVDKELVVGCEYNCRIDWDKRFSRMQSHSGEHIVSGVVHSLFGYDNVGFHMEEEYVTVDFSGELTREQLDLVEDKANFVVYKNEEIVCFFPDQDELNNLDYRSKLDLTENVRLVKIGDTDLCACCAPHVLRTGEIGVIKILDFMRHRGGVRIVMKCGAAALFDYREKYRSVLAVSNLLSSKQNEIADSVERLLTETDNLKHEFYTFKQTAAHDNFKNLKTSGDVSYHISSYYDTEMMRSTVNYGMTASKLCVVFSGDDEHGFSYIAGSNTLDLSSVAKMINSTLNGRGGGRGTMVQGRVSAKAAIIEAFINDINIGEN